MRKPMIAGNWKMNKTVGEAVALVKALKPLVAEVDGVDVVVGPPFTALSSVKEEIDGSGVGLAAQNVHWEDSGAFTGEVSPEMLAEIGCDYVIVAHSERRQYFGETNESAAKKLAAAHAHGLTPIYCVGETLDQRDGGDMESVVCGQIAEGLSRLDATQMRGTVVAYEPVWAIGTGKTASPVQAQEVHALIRAELVALFDSDTAAAVRIQYGGSMKPDNAAELISQPDIDGGLIGGASLDADSFAAIVDAANRLG